MSRPGQVRDEVRAWLANQWDPGLEPRDWRIRVVEAGWAVPTWPTHRHGRGYDEEQAADVGAAFAEVGAPHPTMGPTNDSWLRMLGQALIVHGTSAQQDRLLEPLLRGDLGTGCLLYSEPEAGSDLAALRTRADRDGDEFVVSGHKLWTTHALTASFGLLLARTDWDVPKHQGITFFCLRMHQPGVLVRPLRQATGDSTFNEVFLDRARVAAADMVGPLHGGWRVLQTALAQERSGMGAAHRALGLSTTTPQATVLDGADDLIRAARDAGRADDPLVRAEISRLHGWRLANEWMRVRLAAGVTDLPTAHTASLVKLGMSRIQHTTGRLLRTLAGPDALSFDYDDPTSHAANFAALHAFKTSIAGGTDQIQRTIVAERLLGLPRGRTADDRPFRDVLRTTKEGRPSTPR